METWLPSRCLAMGARLYLHYCGFQSSCHIAPSLRLFVPSSLTAYHLSFSFFLFVYALPRNRLFFLFVYALPRNRLDSAMQCFFSRIGCCGNAFNNSPPSSDAFRVAAVTSSAKLRPADGQIAAFRRHVTISFTIRCYRVYDINSFIKPQNINDLETVRIIDISEEIFVVEGWNVWRYTQ
jgi:hypothetical protein